MKSLIIALFFICHYSVSTAQQQSQIINSSIETIPVSRVVNFWKLVSKSVEPKNSSIPGSLRLGALDVTVVVKDLGGSTDVSPMQTAYLNLYSKGEMFDVEASFNLGNFYEVKGAKRVEAGIYEIYVKELSDESGAYGFPNVTLRVDASKAVYDIRRIDCEGEFGCDASENFSPSATVVRKYKN